MRRAGQNISGIVAGFQADQISQANRWRVAARWLMKPYREPHLQQSREIVKSLEGHHVFLPN